MQRTPTKIPARPPQAGIFLSATIKSLFFLLA
jgi:hypothetical protein